MKHVIAVAVLIPLTGCSAEPDPQALWQEHLRLVAEECRETPADSPFRAFACGEKNLHLPADRVPAAQEEAPRTGSQIYREIMGHDPY